MKYKVIAISALVCVGSSACVAGPGGAHNAANRAVAGIGIGALLGGIAGAAAGDPATGVVIGSLAGGAVGAAMNPKVFDKRDTRGYCYTVDAQGQPILVPLDSVECKEAAARAAATRTR
ncbi:MAG TPA: hypothetical protein VFH89_10905 [Sphingomicrobium sp.]|nr:hypothetical protein [Sphingomicrobium sp.]